MTSHFSSLFTLLTRAENFPAIVSGTVTEDAQVSYWPFVFILFVCLFVFIFPSNNPRSHWESQLNCPSFFRFSEAASVVAMTSSIHKFHHVGFRHFLMTSFRRLWTTGCLVKDFLRILALAKTKQTAILKGNAGNFGLRQCSRLSCRNWLSRLSCNANFKRRERELKMSFHFERTRL